MYWGWVESVVLVLILFLVSRLSPFVYHVLQNFRRLPRICANRCHVAIALAARRRLQHFELCGRTAMRKSLLVPVHLLTHPLRSERHRIIRNVQFLLRVE